MAATDILGQDFEAGINVGQKIGVGGSRKKGGLAQALSQVASALQEAQKRKQDNEDANQLLGVQGLLKGEVTPTSEQTKGAVTGIIPGVGLQPRGQEAYTTTIDPATGQQVLVPIGNIKSGDKIIPPSKSPTGALSNKDLEAAAQLLASGKEAPGQISGFSRQRQQIINRAMEINPNFDPQKAELAFKAGSSEMTNARIQGQKVNQANTLMATIQGNYDPKTDKFNIPPSQHTEIAMGLAKLLSPTGQVSENLTNQLQQGTLHQKLASVAIYFGADPSITSGPTQSLIKFLQKQVDIQGQASQGMLDTYNKGSSPTYKSIKAQQQQTQQNNDNDPLGLR